MYRENVTGWKFPTRKNSRGSVAEFAKIRVVQCLLTPEVLGLSFDTQATQPKGYGKFSWGISGNR